MTQLSKMFNEAWSEITPTKIVGAVGALLLITGLVLMFAETFAGYLLGIGGAILILWLMLVSD